MPSGRCWPCCLRRRGPSLGYCSRTIPRHYETEAAALSELARELDGAAEKPRQTLADVQPKSRAFPGCCDAELLQLLERFEQLGLVFLFDPHPGVTHVEANGRQPVGRSLANVNPPL